MNAPFSELDRLRARNAELEDELAEWRRQYGRVPAADGAADDEARTGAPIHFTSCEWRFLQMLLRCGGRLVGRGHLLDAALAERSDAEGSKVVDVYACKVRRKLRLAGRWETIETVWGCGYRINAGAAESLGRWLARG